MKISKVSFLFNTLLASTQLDCLTAFAPNSFTNINNHIISSSSSVSQRHNNHQVLSALPIGGGSEFYDLHQSLSHVFDSLSTSTLLSDTTAAVVEESKDGGWWNNYLQLYKNALELVHTTVDQPLKNVGWDQTWGVSIFLFTACKSLPILAHADYF